VALLLGRGVGRLLKGLARAQGLLDLAVLLRGRVGEAHD
jgi:hypothetical protein